MQFPNFPADMRNPYLREGLIEDIADRERLFTTRHPEVINLQSVNLGRLCLRLADGDEAVKDLPPNIRGERYLPLHEAKLYSSLRQLVLSAIGREAVHAQEDLHSAAMNLLQETRTQRSSPDWHAMTEKARLKQINKDRGTMTEYVTLGLLTRYAHPNMLAYPSLQHHERDVDVPGHYDVGVIFNNPGNVIETNRIQVKMACFGICRNEGTNNTLQQLQSRYRPSVQLLSGCCHLQSFSQGLSKDQLAEQLLEEYQGNLSQTDIKGLDNTTDNFVLAMTTNQLPRGKHGISSKIAGPEFRAPLNADNKSTYQAVKLHAKV